LPAEGAADISPSVSRTARAGRRIPRWQQLVARVARTSALVLPLLGACSRTRDEPLLATERETPTSAEPILPIPLDEGEEPELVKLGEELFFSPIVSEDGRVSCGSCHLRDRGMADGRPRSELPGRPMTLTNSTTLYNLRYYYEFGWFGQSDSLETSVSTQNRPVVGS